MLADVFVSAFLGCLLALTCVAIGAWQVARWKTARFIKRNASEFLDQLMKDDPKAREDIILAARRASAAKEES